MTGPRLHYVYDPLCGWCYAAAPMVRAAVAAGVELQLHGGGLWPARTAISREQAAHIRGSDDRIADLTGQSFGPSYLHGLLEDDATSFWSLPPIAAVLVAGDARPGADLQMLEAIQAAHYVAGRRVVDTEVLTDLAGDLGLRREIDAQVLEAARLEIEQSKRLMSRQGLRGFPSFVLETEAGWVRVSHEAYYGRPSAFLEQLHRDAAAPAA